MARVCFSVNRYVFPLPLLFYLFGQNSFFKTFILAIVPNINVEADMLSISLHVAICLSIRCVLVFALS